MTPLVSIIIPTRDRYATLFPVVRALSKHLEPGSFEILVQDNSTCNAPALAFLNELNDSRVRYAYHPEPVSIVENTVRAITASSGRYLLFIGDDDLVCPQLCRIVAEMEAASLECLTYRAAYWWWDTVSFASKSHYHRPGAFWLPKGVSGETRLHNSHVEVDKVLARGAVHFFDLPRFYHGIVRRDVLDRIKARTGRQVPGASPDMAFALSLGLVTDSYAHFDFPVSVFGASKGSGGGRTAERKHFGRLEDQKHLPAETVANWDKRIPRIWSEQTIYPQTAVEVLSRFGLDLPLRVEQLYASMLVNEPWLARDVLPLALAFAGEGFGNAGALAGAAARKLGGRLWRGLRSAGGRMPYTVEVVRDADACMRLLAGLTFRPPSMPK